MIVSRINGKASIFVINSDSEFRYFSVDSF